MKPKIQAFPAGTEIYRQGEPGGTMYVIQSGKVEIVRTVDGWRHALAVLEKNDFFGEMAIVAHRAHNATAVAVEDTKALAVSAETLSSMLRANDEIAARMIITLVGRLEQSNHKLGMLLRYHEQHVRGRPLGPRPDTETPASGSQVHGATPTESAAAPSKAKETAAETSSESSPDEEFDTLWARISDVIIDKDYKTALSYLQRAEGLRPDDPRVARYRRRLEHLSKMSAEDSGSDDQAYRATLQAFS